MIKRKDRFRKQARPLEKSAHALLALAESGWVWGGTGSRAAGLPAGAERTCSAQDAALLSQQKTCRMGGRAASALTPFARDRDPPAAITATGRSAVRGKAHRARFRQQF